MSEAARWRVRRDGDTISVAADEGGPLCCLEIMMRRLDRGRIDFIDAAIKGVACPLQRDDMLAQSGLWSRMGFIESFLAYGGYRLLRGQPGPSRNTAVGFWMLNNLLIAGWSGLFFGRRALGPSALTAGGMIAVAGGYAAVASRTDKVAAATALPLIGWLASLRSWLRRFGGATTSSAPRLLGAHIAVHQIRR